MRTFSKEMESANPRGQSVGFLTGFNRLVVLFCRALRNIDLWPI